MYKVGITNNYRYSLTASNGMIINPAQFLELGHFDGHIHIPGMGDLKFFDLREAILKEFPLKGSLGALVRYKSIELYNRYDGEGYIYMVVDSYGDISANARGSSAIIQMKELKIDPTRPV